MKQDYEQDFEQSQARALSYLADTLRRARYTAYLARKEENKARALAMRDATSHSRATRDAREAAFMRDALRTMRAERRAIS